ncbi:hypothetical protein BKA80DRAFT_302585 [Phyllosticta citrichinensis]
MPTPMTCLLRSGGCVVDELVELVELMDAGDGRVAGWALVCGWGNSCSNVAALPLPHPHPLLHPLRRKTCTSTWTPSSLGFSVLASVDLSVSPLSTGELVPETPLPIRISRHRRPLHHSDCCHQPPISALPTNRAEPQPLLLHVVDDGASSQLNKAAGGPPPARRSPKTPARVRDQMSTACRVKLQRRVVEECAP